MKEEKAVEQKSTFKTSEVITLVITTCVVSLIMGVLIAKPFKKDNMELADENIQKFLKEYNYIIDNYYGEIDEKKLLETALASIVDSLGDPYSSSFDKNESESFNSKLNGSYEGIGVEIANTKENKIIVTNVFENTPAKKSGIKIGDILETCNGKNIATMKTSEFVDMVKKLGNKQLIIGLVRNQEKKEVTVNRTTVTLKSVSAKTFTESNKKIGYINISIFAANTDKQFKAELEKLEKEKITSLIIDLRGNTGGHLTATENMISQFLDSSKVIYQIEDKKNTKKYHSKGTETKKYPIVVLVDNGSASASEMMAAALKESYGATIVGMTTYGKGTVQEMQNSNNENLQYKITTKKWLTPKGNWINDVGIKPDVEIALTIDYLKNPSDKTDSQLQKALEILKKDTAK